MDEPGRLLEQGGSPLERAVLQAGVNERPSRSEKHRALAALGLLCVAPSLVATTPAAAAAGGAKLVILKVATWSVALGLAGAAVGFHLAQDTPADTERATAPVAIAAKPAAPPPAAPRPPVAEDPPPELAPATSPPEPPARRPRAAQRQPSPKRSVGDEVQMLDRARAALRNHQPSSALRAIDAYRSRYPHGVLREEAAVLRVEALRDRGESQAAATAARRFERKYPTSAHAPRIRRAPQAATSR